MQLTFYGDFAFYNFTDLFISYNRFMLESLGFSTPANNDDFTFFFPIWVFFKNFIPFPNGSG
jgi:hypothetical protein